MNVIKQNPFRVLGLLGNSTERELQKQIGIIKRYAEIGKTKSFDYDLQIIGNLSRTSEEIQVAASSIEQAHKKLLYSLFWFIKNSPLDEVALNHLNQNTDKAIEIWNKTLKEEVTPKNYSAYLNLSTLYLALSTIGKQLSINELQQAIILKGQLINSESLLDLSKEVTGNGIGISSDDVNKAFVDEVISSLKPFLDNANGIKTKDLISLFNSYPASVQKYLASKFTEIPISNIENKIDHSASKRNNKPRDAEEYGEELYEQTKSDLTLLKKLQGNDSIQYQMLANKVANEILQCSIDFFNELQDEENGFDPGDDALRVAKYATLVGATGQTLNRINESIETLNEIKYRDCYQVINILKSIKNAFIKLDNDNQSRSFRERLVIDQSKVTNLMQENIKEDAIERIASSANNNLIDEFHELITYLYNRINNKRYLKELEDVFFNSLPKNSSARAKLLKQREVREENERQRKLRDKELALKRQKEREESERKEQAQKATKTLIWIGALIGGVALVYGIWGEDGLAVLGVIAFFLFIGWLKSL